MKRLVTILIAILSISQLYSQNRIGPYRSIPLKSKGDSIVVRTFKFDIVSTFMKDKILCFLFSNFFLIFFANLSGNKLFY